MAQMEQAKGLHTQHFFADGMYCRWLFRPAGTLIVGKVHKREHFYLVVQGRVRVVGHGEPQTLEAPALLVSAPGTKRAVLSLTDATCLTVHRTALTDLDAIEGELLEEEPLARFNARNEEPLLELP